MDERLHICPLCEAGCGLIFEMEEGEPVAVRGDHDDVLSQGYLCPKGAQILNLERDPDRLTQPMRRTPEGDFVPISWEEALEAAVTGLKAVQKAHGRDAIAAFMGTVMVHKYGSLLSRDALKSALGTRNWSGVSSQDTSARFVSSHFLYGSAFSLCVPDIERTDYFLCIGANPVVSNGSMLTAPNIKVRLQNLINRGAQMVVVDPRRSETAQLATKYVSIRPGTDAAFVLSLVQHIVDQGLVDDARMAKETRGWEALRSQIAPFTPEAVSKYVGIPQETIKAVAEGFAAAPSSAAYSRMGPGNARHATLTCFAVELLNITVGRLGQIGGAMFATPAIDLTQLARLTGGDGFDRYRSRVRGLPETVGELPATTLAEEMETPGEGQVKALITYAANPVLSVPNGRRLDKAIQGLDFMVSIDIYINETTRHADIILPPASTLAEDHADFFFANYNVRNAMRWSEPVVEKRGGERLDWEILLALAEGLGGGITAIRPVDALLKTLGISLTPADIATWALRMGPFGDRFLPWSKGLNRARLRESPHGVDLGPLKPGFRRRVFHRGKRLHLDHPPINAAMSALLGEIQNPEPGRLLLIGRRSLRSNNSWMHNVPKLVAGKDRCVLYIHPKDADRVGAKSGDSLIMESRVHRGLVPIQITDEVREGVVSLPHGFGHGGLGRWQKTASARPGVSVNDWTDDAEVEAIVGQSILNGVPVQLHPMES